MPVTAWSAPSVVTTTGSGQLATPEPVSVQTNVTVTAELFQPAGVDAGRAVAVMVGGRVSMETVADAEAVLPATSVAVPGTT